MTEAVVRVGALIDRAVVAERLAARSTPLLRKKAPAEGASLRSEGGVVGADVDFAAVDRARQGTAVGREAFVAYAAIDVGRRTGHAVDVGVPGASDLRLPALAGRLGPTRAWPVEGLGILTLGAISMRPTAIDDGSGGWAIVVHPIGSLLLASADGAGFLEDVRGLLEHWTVQP